MPEGYLALVLHAHLPFVRHPEHDEMLEEDWLYEAITETYLPLLDMCERLTADGVKFQFTITLSPSLCEMLRDELLIERYRRRLRKLIELAAKEESRTYGDWRFHFAAKLYHDRFRRYRVLFDDVFHRDLVGAFRKYQDRGAIEIITCSATHAFLPHYVMYPEAVHAQIHTAADAYRRLFDRDPPGIWLPECGYFPGVDRYLRAENIRYFFTDTHGVVNATPRPRFGVYAPIYCPTGVAAFGRDHESGRQVWSAEAGYPGDPDYREFYRDIGYDRDLEYIRPYIQANSDRKMTGLKYFRVTGRVDLSKKEPYVREWALEKAARHAEHFMRERETQVQRLHGVMGRPPIIVSPYDAELFGHWWFEGPEFIELLIRKAAFDQNTFEMIAPGEYLRRHPQQQVAVPSLSSWGHKGYGEMWLGPDSDWIYPHIHKATERMIELARRFTDPTAEQRTALNQAAREVLLAESSDWPFILKTGTVVPYAVRQIKTHLVRFNKLYDMLNAGVVDTAEVERVAALDNPFAHVDYRWFRGGV